MNSKETMIARARWNKDYKKAGKLISELNESQSQSEKFVLQGALLELDQGRKVSAQNIIESIKVSKETTAIFSICLSISNNNHKMAKTLIASVEFHNPILKYEQFYRELQMITYETKPLNDHLKYLDKMIQLELNLEEDLIDKFGIMTKTYNTKGAESMLNQIKNKFPNSDKIERLEEIFKNLKILIERQQYKHNNNSYKKLESFIGLESVKSSIKNMFKLIEYNKERNKALNLPEKETKFNLNFVFKGNPGTGKTSIARIIGEILAEEGILESGHLVEVDRSKLVGKYIGHSEDLTLNKIKEAMGGVLFIDEAYSINVNGSNNDFGQQVIDTLTKEIEDRKGELCVIFAGYPKEIDDFLNANVGLKSRIGSEFYFEDYSDTELIKIAKKMARNDHYKLTDSSIRYIKDKLKALRLSKSFGNAREIEKLISTAISRKAHRTPIQDITKENTTILTENDFGKISKDERKVMVEEAMFELNSLVGLKSVKEEIEDIKNHVNYNNRLKKRGDKVFDLSYHMIFKGNPGTGKTTVAKILGRIFNALGILKTGKFIYADREMLISPQAGGTAIKTKKLINKALGGVLFIDEAYSLTRGVGGHEAVDTLIKEMEDHRENLMVILAGYDQEMDDLLDLNPGFRSRVNKHLQFEDYNEKELLEIFMLILKDHGYSIDNDAIDELRKYIHKIYINKSDDFGNAREIRNLFSEVVTEIANRVFNTDVPDDRLKSIIKEDIIELE